MTRPPPQDRGYPLLASLIARDLKTWQTRIARAEEVMADARSPLKGAGYGTPTVNSDGGSSPPPGIAFDKNTGDLRVDGAQAVRQLKELHDIVNTLDRLTRRGEAILGEWAPPSVKSELTIWCENHLRYGQHVAHADDGSRNCGWCCNIHRTYKVWPNRPLIDMHDRGRRIFVADIQRHLGKQVVA